jgi:CRP-like cAMP-binding protein
LKFARLYSALAPGNREISFPLRRADLAKFSGTTIESAVRCLTRLKGQGIISIAGRDIRILKPDALIDFAGDEPAG